MRFSINSWSTAGLVVATSLFSRHTAAKAVFAHYVVGTVDSSTDHACTDINEAIAAGLDAFALDVLAPTQSYASNTIGQLFDCAAGTSFGLFFSFDLYADGNIQEHLNLYNQFSNHANYYQLSGKNVISSFRGEALGPDGWSSVKSETNGYIVPNLDQAQDYFSDPATFFSTYGDSIDGVLSWETAWPEQSDTPVNVSDSQDESVLGAARSAEKVYWMGLSSLQFKDCCNAGDYYRVGEVNLPERMTQILSLQPDNAEVITWNDAGESHYIGPIWPEGLGGTNISSYGNSDAYTHNAWQPLVGSFADAFRNGVTADAMVPFNGAALTGAMWYRGVLKSCAGELPAGAGAAIDAVNYAVVLPSGSDGYSIRVTSNGQVLTIDPAQAGLNYNSIGGMQTGSQLVEVLDGSGSVVASAPSAVDVQQGPVDGFCNFNYYVVGL